MKACEQLARLANQRAHPEFFVPCRWCSVGRQCPHCAGTGKVSKATARELADFDRARRAVA